MSEQKKELSVTERKRVQNMKNLIIVLLFCAIIIPCACCMILFLKLSNLGQSVEKLTGEVVTLRTEIAQWQSEAGTLSKAPENVANGNLSDDASSQEALLQGTEGNGRTAAECSFYCHVGAFQ